MKPILLDVVSRISSRIFLGPDICRNEEWLNLTKGYTINLFTGAMKLRVWPKFLRPYAHWFIPECVTLRNQVRDVRRLIEPLIQHRRDLRAAALANGEKPPYFNDALDWADEEAAATNLKYDPAAFQLMLSVGAIHTTTDLLVQVMLDLAQHQEYFQPAREEIISELKAGGGWKKTSVHNMKTLDSFAKESQRLKPVSLGEFGSKLPDTSTQKVIAVQRVN